MSIWPRTRRAVAAASCTVTGTYTTASRHRHIASERAVKRDAIAAQSLARDNRVPPGNRFNRDFSSPPAKLDPPRYIGRGETQIFRVVAPTNDDHRNDNFSINLLFLSFSLSLLPSSRGDDEFSIVENGNWKETRKDSVLPNLRKWVSIRGEGGER